MNTGYPVIVIHWRLRETMQRHGVTRYALQKHSGIAMNTIRSMYDGETERPDLGVLNKIIKALHEMNVIIGINDILEFVPDNLP